MMVVGFLFLGDPQYSQGEEVLLHCQGFKLEATFLQGNLSTVCIISLMIYSSSSSKSACRKENNHNYEQKAKGHGVLRLVKKKQNKTKHPKQPYCPTIGMLNSGTFTNNYSCDIKNHCRIFNMAKYF